MWSTKCQSRPSSQAEDAQKEGVEVEESLWPHGPHHNSIRLQAREEYSALEQPDGAAGPRAESECYGKSICWIGVGAELLILGRSSWPELEWST